MTTIAFRNGVLAADTAMTQGNSRMGFMTKIARRSDGKMAGAAGRARYCMQFLEWFKAGELDLPPTATESEHHFDRGVIFRPNGEIEVFDPGGTFKCRADYYAFGSGSDYALGAMFVGAGASEAVQAAIAHDTYSGGSVEVLRS